MKIKTRIQVSITLCIVLTVTIGLFVFMAIQEMNDKSREAKVAAIIVKDMAELNIATHEYLLHPGERPLVQWKSKYDSLANRLTREENKFDSPDEKISLNKIHQNLVRLGTVFSKLTTDFGKERGLDRQKDPISSELQDRLIGELLIKSQATVSPVFHLQRVIHDEIEVAQKRSSFLIYIFLVVFMFLVVGILIWINKSMARPIIMLEEGTQIIGAGNLSHKVGTEAKDEIGALSRSFDKMIEDLKKSTTSIVDLNKEIVERKQAEDALRERTTQLKDVNRQLQKEIAERKHAEEHAKESLREKEVLLREIHHRVKNNLAVISSLLNMQANKIKGQDVHAALQESQNRISAMALIHETLYQSENLALVDLEGYVKRLFGNIMSVFDGKTRRVSFKVKAQDVKLEVEQAASCGLIINELTTNALKHAFADGKDGIVWIKADYVSEKEIELTVSDNGIGIPEGLDWRKSQSLGLRLISLMVEQLHGTWEIKNNQGTEITIRWPLYK